VCHVCGGKAHLTENDHSARRRDSGAPRGGQGHSVWTVPTESHELHHHKRKDFDVSAKSGHEFVIALRQSSLNVMDFSAILGYKAPGLFTVFRLRRYNGSSHRHTNALEKQTIDGFHVHTATERYQKAGGFKEDHFAELTTRYSNLVTAIECLLNECGFRSPLEESPLFTGQAE
jgi:hypothetical protein